MGRRRVGPLIVGSGIAGLYVAVRCHELGLRPRIVTKSSLEESTTRYAQGGIAAALGTDDSVGLHLRDTVRAGDGLVDGPAARVLTGEAPRRIEDLVRLGVPFDTIEGQVQLGREAAHTRARILHAGGDTTGLRIEESLRERAVEMGVEAQERTVLRQVVADRKGVRVLLSRARGGSEEEVWATPLVLATGGAGRLYRESTNPDVATGEGIAIAFRAGALVEDMEFVQFHPTAFFHRGAPRHLISEAVRGEGAVLRTSMGDRFMPRYHPAAELAPRDVVSRAIHSEMARTHARCVYLDATPIPPERFRVRFPSIFRFLASYGIDPSQDPIPVTPVAHYSIGGVATDLHGRSSLAGVLAVGEVAATGVHGANRLASNSLLEGLVFGERVARQARRPGPGGPSEPGRTVAVPLGRGRGRARAASMVELQRALWQWVGIVREAEGLEKAIARFERVLASSEPTSTHELPGPIANAALTGLLTARAALVREESRGVHFRSDFPRRRPAWRLHIGLLASRNPASGQGPTTVIGPAR